MPEDSRTEPPTKKRVRTGCLTCRRRRRKCDEAKPICANCQTKRIKCSYGLNLTFLTDNASSLNEEDIRSFPGSTAYSEIKFVVESSSPPLGREDDDDGGYVSSSNDRGHNSSSITAGSGHESQGVHLGGDSNSPSNEAYGVTSISPQASSGYGCYPEERISFSATNTSNSCATLSPPPPPINPASSSDSMVRMNGVNREGDDDDSYVSGCNPSSAMDAVNLSTLQSNYQAVHETVDSGARCASSVGEKELQLLKYYRYEVAPWLDICDSFQRFGLDLLFAGKTHRPLNDAIFAISSRRQELLQNLPTTESSESTLYSRSSEALLTLDLQTHDQNAIYTYTLLKFSDLMSAEPQDWKREMRNVSSCLVDNLRFQAFSGGIIESVFWNYVRMDISGALAGGGTTTTLPVQEWFPQGIKLSDSQQIFLLRRNMDDWARYSMLLCAQAIDLRSERNLLSTLGTGAQPADYTSRWIEIWNQTQTWHRDRPIELISVFEAAADSLDGCSANVFPTAIFSTGCAILANQLHHTTALLLLQCKPRMLRLSSGKTSHVWHAQQICGISASNDESKTWDFTLLASLLVAARVMTHSAQHAVVLETLERVRRITGWRVGSEIDRLRSFWNLAGG